MDSPDSQPLLLVYVKFLPAGMHEIKLASRILLMKTTITPQGVLTISAAVDHGYRIEMTPVVRRRMRLQCLDNEPLVWIGLAYRRPLCIVFPLDSL
jgi:hypothetical protein